MRHYERVTREVWFRFVALGALMSFVALSLRTFPTPMLTCVAISGVCFLAAIGIGIHKIRSRDQYNLQELREMVLEGSYNDADVPEVDADADIYCMHCHHVYGSKFKVCPKCGR